MTRPLTPEDLRARCVVDANGCWIWKGTLNDKGYARTAYQGRRQMVHRVLYEVERRAPIPSGMTLDHLCRVRCCVNPAHMEVVTPTENKIRGARARGWSDETIQLVRSHTFWGGRGRPPNGFTGTTVGGLARKLGIPHRTVRNWIADRSR